MTEQNFDEFEVTGDSNPLDLMMDLFKSKNIEMKSDVTDFDIGVIIELKWQQMLNKHPESTALDIFIEYCVPLFLQLKVSRNRLSRIEAQKILSAIIPSTLQSDTNIAQQAGLKV